MMEEIRRKIARWLKENGGANARREEGARAEAYAEEVLGGGRETVEIEGATVTAAREELLAPQTVEEFIGVLKRTPKSVLSAKDRNRIAAVMSFDDREVRDLMVPKRKMVFVEEDEVLGPLVLDKLYKSGYNNFPVVDKNKRVLGVIHTEALNALKIRETDKATKFMDENVQYLRVNDPLSFAIDEIERTSNYYFLVLDELETLAGFFTVQQLLDYLLS